MSAWSLCLHGAKPRRRRRAGFAMRNWLAEPPARSARSEADDDCWAWAAVKTFLLLGLLDTVELPRLNESVRDDDLEGRAGAWDATLKSAPDA